MQHGAKFNAHGARVYLHLRRKAHIKKSKKDDNDDNNEYPRLN
jgi:hypothetical protein